MKFWFRLAVISSCVLSAWAQPATPAAPPATPAAENPAQKSALDAVLFYQLLLGELNVRSGSPGSGFSLILDAARKTNDPRLFQRAVDLALQSRSGDAALQAAQAWKKAIPQATEANRYVLQILLALNKVDEAGQALTDSIRELPEVEQSMAIASVPRVFSRVQDKQMAADTVEKALAFALKQSSTAATTWTTIGRMRRDSGQLPLAIEAARQGHAADAKASAPLILALSLANSTPAEMSPFLAQAMQGDVQPPLRLGYVRHLIGQAQQAQALHELKRLNAEHPTFSEAWLVHGLMLQENSQWSEAEKKLRQYVQLVQSSQDKDEQARLSEALMALAQIAQRLGQLNQAAQWLSQVPAAADPIKLASRQADLLSQQGRSEEARQVLAQIKTTNTEQAIRKALVQSVWLRDNKRFDEAYTVVKQAMNANAPNSELLSELAMVTEKLKRFDEMESLLRELMQLKPQDPHAFNALGYSLADRNVRLDEARQLIMKALKLSPNDAYIQDSLGWVAFRQGQLSEARDILQAAYKARPDAEIAAHLGEVLWSMGQQKEAQAIWREGLLLKADNETLVETLKRFDFKP
ncbi:tetratricopeptide repeat protein [Limnohabitans sp. 2KL-3]|uniref:tetratricopeptide repeat protein n=1 Tax=Limnohabitans sp. 2KL-3 TaxID=1100700 RepID=UPI000B1BF082|nr:tetratricopeptide repeat protein [Limnohabitans sp. 2KL-3]